MVLVLPAVLTLVVVVVVMVAHFRRWVSAKPATSDRGHSPRIVSTVSNPTYVKQQLGESSTDDVNVTFPSLYDTVEVLDSSRGAVADEDGYLSVSGTEGAVAWPSTANRGTVNAMLQPQDHTWHAATVENPGPPSTPKTRPGNIRKANKMYLAAGDASKQGDAVTRITLADQLLGDRLLDAAEEGDVDAIREILHEPGSDVNYFSGGLHALFIASAEGHTDAVELLLRSSADVNRLSGGNGKTALLKASVRGHIDVVKLLLDNGAKDIEKAWDHANALFAAAYGGRLDAMQLLIDHGSNMENRLAASPHMKDQDAKYIGSTPLIVASFFDQPGAIELLLSAGADRTARTENGESALDVAPSAECRQLLLPEPQN